jgi:hypothetical protein
VILGDCERPRLGRGRRLLRDSCALEWDPVPGCFLPDGLGRPLAGVGLVEQLADRGGEVDLAAEHGVLALRDERPHLNLVVALRLLPNELDVRDGRKRVDASRSNPGQLDLVQSGLDVPARAKCRG